MLFRSVTVFGVDRIALNPAIIRLPAKDATREACSGVRTRSEARAGYYLQFRKLKLVDNDAVEQAFHLGGGKSVEQAIAAD